MVKHGMIDLETLGNTHDTVVLTIGACKFNPFTNEEPFEKLHLKLNVTQQKEEMNRQVNQDTLMWWGRQPADVREEAFCPENRISIEDAHSVVKEWASDISTIWCQGPSFDFPILKHLFESNDLITPWDWWRERDARTVEKLIPFDKKEVIDFSAHRADEDCVAQSKTIQYVFKELKITNVF